MKEGESGVFIFPQTSQLTEPTILTVKFASTRNETEQIDEFVKTKYAGLEVVKTSTGLQYVITKSTATGDLVKSGQTITVSYTGNYFILPRSEIATVFIFITKPLILVALVLF